MALVVLLAATVTVVFDSASIVVFGVSMFFVTWANQTSQSANQNRVLRTNAEASAQANTVFMVGVFLGGSLGAFLGVTTYGFGGMTAVAVQAVMPILLALGCWVVTVRGARRAGTPLRST